MRERRLRKLVQDHLLESAEVKRLTSEACADSILRAAELITRSLESGGKLMLCGNGGSAADCQHIAAEFVSWVEEGSGYPFLPALALSTDTSCLTAIGNDFGFEHVFEVQVKALGKKGDLLLGISTSGDSEDVIQAVKAAKELGITTIGFLGQGGRLKELVDIPITVPSDRTMRIQEAHITIGHIICELVKRSWGAEGEDG